MLYVGKAKSLRSRVRNHFAVDYATSLKNREMVRRITGMLAEVGRGNLTYDGFERLLKFHSDAAAKFTAPPSGLFLEQTGIVDGHCTARREIVRRREISLGVCVLPGRRHERDRSEHVPARDQWDHDDGADVERAQVAQIRRAGCDADQQLIGDAHNELDRVTVCRRRTTM